MKILLCSDSEILVAGVTIALEAAGHQVVAEEKAEKLATGAKGANALLIDPGRAKMGIRLLRERGFAGRALVLVEAEGEALQQHVVEAGADGGLSPNPPEDLAKRFVAALGGRRRVLIIDDSEIAAQLLAAELEDKGFEIHHAPDAETATSMILKKATRPDLILLDINMPRIDGAHYCRFLKKNAMFRAIKVVLCSGENPDRVATVAKECGADGYILKDQFLGRWIAEHTES